VAHGSYRENAAGSLINSVTILSRLLSI